MRWVARAALWWIAVACATGCASGRPDSVVIIVVDTLRADHLGFYGYERETSPELDARAGRGRVFERAYTTAPWTLPAFGSLMTGLLPSEHSAGLRLSADGSPTKFSKLTGDVPTLAQLLGARYWATGAVVSNPFLHANSGIARGFDSYNWGLGKRRADEGVDAALAWLASHGEQRFLLILHLFDPHTPYDAPPPFRGRFTGPREKPAIHRSDADALRAALRRGDPIDRDLLSAAYDEEIAFVDHEIGRFLRELETRGLHQRTLVVLVADHGEELFDHGGLEHGHTVFEEVLRVPLVIWGPGVDAERVATPVSLRDIPATVLDALGVPPPPGFGGRSLLADGAPQTVVAERTLYGSERKSALAWPWKLHWTDGGDRLALFDLSSDPAERLDVWASQKEVAQPLAELLNEAAAKTATMVERPEIEIDEQTREELRALGYFD